MDQGHCLLGLIQVQDMVDLLHSGCLVALDNLIRDDYFTPKPGL